MTAIAPSFFEIAEKTGSIFFQRHVANWRKIEIEARLAYLDQ
jgi:hypothetical protein